MIDIIHPPYVVCLGKQTENGVHEIEFDCAAWLEEYPGLSINVMPTRPTEQTAYPAAVRRDGRCVTWIVSGADTAIKGYGTVELLGTVDGKRKISATIKTHIQETSLAKTGEVPEAATPWVDQVLDAAERAEAAAERAESAGGGSSGAVESVNGKTGAVELSAADVGALPSDTPIPTVPENVSAFTNDAGYLTKHQDLSDYAKKSEIPNVSAFITRAVSDLEFYYLKSQTYTRDEIDQKVSAIPKFTISVVSALPSTGISATTIYLVPGGADNNLYTEYINVNGTWEILGSQRVDLTGYATQSWTLEQLKGKLDANKLPEAINTALAQAKASGEFDGAVGKDGTSVTVKSVNESTADGGSNVVTFSDGKTVTIKNGSKGSKGDAGKTPVLGTDYWTAEDVAAINAESQAYIDDKLAELDIGGTTSGTVAETGVVVSLETDKDTQITVEGDASAQVTLVHQGKNFCPSGLLNVPNYNNKGITVTANEDGTHTLAGKATSYVNYYLAHSSYGTTIYLPAGTYTKTIYIDGDVTDTQNNVSVNSMFEENGTAVTSTIPTVHSFNRSRTFTLNEPKYIRSMIYVPQGVTLDCVVAVQYELGDTSTPFEPYVKTTQSVTLPTTVNAMDGANVFYTMTGETLTCSYTLSKEDTTLEEVKKLLKFDPAPYGLPILHLSGSTANMSKDDAVTLDYVYGELSGTCTCKWQGSSSVRYAKKNYTIKFDEAFEAKEGWGAQKKYCLKANFIDPSHARNIVAARLWGQIIASRSTVNTNLAACPNYGAVDGFPCVIMLNDEFHGLYTWNIPKDGWMLNFPTDGATRECILCAEGVNASGGEAFKATETALDVGFSLEYITDESNTGWALTSLNNLISACIASDGTDLDTTLAAMIDWDSVVDYFCFSAALGNYDGIIKNYLLYTRDGTKWYMGAYDLDCLWGNWWDGSKFIGVNDGSYPASLMSKHRLLELAGRYKASKIKSRYKYLRQSVLREDLVSAEVANIIGSIPSVIFAEEHKTWPTLKMTSVDGHAQMVNWYRNRVAAVDALIDAMT